MKIIDILNATRVMGGQSLDPEIFENLVSGLNGLKKTRNDLDKEYDPKLQKKGEKILVCVFSTYDDISSDGTAKMWWIRKGQLNIELNCKSIIEMLTPQELFDITFDVDQAVEIEKERVAEYCTAEIDIFTI